MYSRLYIIHNVGIEDYSIIVEWLLSVAFSIVSVLLCKYGLDVHLWNIPLTTFSPYYLKLDLSLTIIYCLCILFIKLSILQLYLRISPDGKFRATVYLVIAIVVGYNLGSAPMNLFSCDPIARTWDFSISVGSSINRPVFYFANAGLNIGTDLIMIVLPILMLRNLHLPMGQKDGLIGIFMAGSLYATLQTLLEGLTNIRHSYCEMCLSRAIPDSQRCQKRIPSACSGLRDLARSEQQQLKSKDGNGKCLCRDSDVEYAVLSASAMDAFGDLNIVALQV